VQVTVRVWERFRDKVGLREGDALGVGLGEGVIVGTLTLDEREADVVADGE